MPTEPEPLAVRRLQNRVRTLRRALALTACRGAARGDQGRVTLFRGPLRDLLADAQLWPEDRWVEVEVTAAESDL